MVLGPQGLLLDPIPSHRGRGPDTHDPVFEGDQLLLLLLAVLEMRLNQRLQLVQVLLHALPVDVLGGGAGLRGCPPPPCQGGGAWVQESSWGRTQDTVRHCVPPPVTSPPPGGPEVSPRGPALPKPQLTSKSTLSPSGILGGTRLGMNSLVGRRRCEHQALPGPRGCGAWAGKVLSSLQKRGRRHPDTGTVTPAWRAHRSPQAAQHQGPTAPARALTFTHRVGTSRLTQGSRDSET